MNANRIVSPDEWLAARKQHLAQEKELTRLRDELCGQRRELPWVRVEKCYVFDGPDGTLTPPGAGGPHYGRGRLHHPEIQLLPLRRRPLQGARALALDLEDQLAADRLALARTPRSSRRCWSSWLYFATSSAGRTARAEPGA